MNVQRYYYLNELCKNYKLVDEKDRIEFQKYAILLLSKINWENRSAYMDGILFLNYE